MFFDIDFQNRRTEDVDYATAIDLGYPPSAVGAALKGAAKQQVAQFADSYRAKLASQSAGKLAEYRIKEEIARNPDAASDAELALISREAKARGTNLTGLITQINAQAAAYRQIALLIGALEAEAGTVIAAISDDADDIEAQVQTVLDAARAQAETAFAEALALINGG